MTKMDGLVRVLCDDEFGPRSPCLAVSGGGCERCGSQKRVKILTSRVRALLAELKQPSEGMLWTMARAMQNINALTALKDIPWDIVGEREREHWYDLAAIGWQSMLAAIESEGR